jgi:hypothetical protein
MGALTKSIVDMMTHIVAAGQGTFPQKQRLRADILRQMGWITVRDHGPNIICEATENGKRSFADYLRREKDGV